MRLFQQELARREAAGEKFSCLIWVFVIGLTYGLFLLQSATIEPQLVRYISGLVAVFLPCFGAVYATLHFYGFHWSLTFINSFLQISLVSGAIYFDALVYGAQYALSSMPPLAYALVIVVTAFRLRPTMGVFSGNLAAFQFGLLYWYIRSTDSRFTDELIKAVPSLDWSVTVMKLIILIAMGIACSFTAVRLRKELLSYVRHANTERRLELSLGRYVSTQVAAQLAETDNDTIAAEELANVTVMIGDIRGFTEYANRHNPTEVAAFLNRYFDMVNSAVEAHGGVLNKFLGDGFLAVFGLFHVDETPEKSAVAAGCDIIKITQSHLASENLSMGIALNNGPVIAGEIGAEGRCEYTVIGDTVNVAARIESMNRRIHTQLIARQSVVDALPANWATTKALGSHQVRGLSDPIELSEIISCNADSQPIALPQIAPNATN